MTELKLSKDDLYNSLDENEGIVTRYYKLAIFVFIAIIIIHISFSTYFLVSTIQNNSSQTISYVTINIVFLIIEVFISRIAFMLGSRSGQIRDIKLMLLISDQDFHIEKIEKIASTIMSLRRDENKMKILDIEKISEKFQKK